ncbi:MAG: HEAT repeat domain-containing protein [Acidimicrobiales bacterium]
MTNPEFTRSPENARRLEAAVAGYTAESKMARDLVNHPNAKVRASSLRALDRLGALSDDQISEGLADEARLVRMTSAELAAHYPNLDLVMSLNDEDPGVVEVAAWSIGEHEIAEALRIDALIEVSRDHESALCREAAVAALGAIGDERGLEAILAATKDRATVRRRAIISLAPFSGAAVDEALNRAKDDRDFQVRQAAEDQLDINP